MTGPSLQTLTLEYRASIAFDGTTPAPPFSEGELDERQIYVFEVDRLGIIPLQFGEEEATSNSPLARKVMSWMVAYGGVVDPLSAILHLGLVNYSDTTTAPLVIKPLVLQDPAAVGVYSPRCQSISQGYSLIISNMLPQGSLIPLILRLRIVQLQSPEDEASWMAACCCKANLPDNQIPRA